MNDTSVAFGAHRKSAILKYLKHRGILREYVRNKLRNSASTPDCGKMFQQRGSDTLSLVLINYQKSQFRPTGLENDVATATDNGWKACFFADRNQCDVSDEIWSQEK